MANASTTDEGITPSRKSTVPFILPGSVYAAMLLVSSVVGSMCMPAPGCNMLTTTNPMMSATVDTTSKYSKARPPVLPTFFMSSMPAIPTTTVQKMMGAMIILMSLMKPSPSGFMSVPICG